MGMVPFVDSWVSPKQANMSCFLGLIGNIDVVFMSLVDTTVV